MSTYRLNVNGKPRTVQADPDTPALYVLRNDLGLNGPKFGCGLAQCGSCTVIHNGEAIRSCVYPASALQGGKTITLDGLGAEGRLHPVQQAFIDEEAAQCGYCANAWIMTMAAALEKNPKMSEEELREALSGLKCRCGTHMAFLRAGRRAAEAMAAAAAAGTGDAA
ncbi:MAG: (2Fe-2S)-binding protein [Pigmentiphaga sp.]|uniref:(2Fe-2S)-binding protein n=1 Tax=Pigmentiphaga sp. TaxID=1977564 RepID=UPI0029A14EB3|nr:(2Fe-2S)-binding protein [Pigmentiphaga sp.]MDX3904173.1 (2Fe-2S)-binding protein [Pigmentiphaga sp.]